MKSSTGSSPSAVIAEKDVRDALARIVVSPAFRASPQLASFLAFVVEATLSGRSDRIKGYTIAVEALGRDEKFDPQADPIVRVEAGRLRRALGRYYEGPGKSDPIIIELPRGSYVPIIRTRDIVPDVVPPLRKFRALLASLDFRSSNVLIPAVIVLGIFAHGALDWLRADSRSHPHEPVVTATTTRVTPPPAQRLFVGPSILIERVKSAGEPQQPTILPAALENRLRDIFARFDDVTIISAPLHPGKAGYTPGAEPTADYRLATSIDYNEDGTLTVRFQFIDDSDGSILWARTVEKFEVARTPPAVKHPIAREVAAALLQPFGVVHSRERIKRAAMRHSEPRYACLLESFEYFRSYDLPRHARIRGCLEDVTRHDPTFASGFSSLARLYFREFLFGLSNHDEIRPLDRALEMARRAIELKPNHVRAYFVLLDIHMARGEIAEAIAAGEKAIALNPYDTTAAFHYGAQLVLLGDIDAGLQLISEGGRSPGMTAPRYLFVQSAAAYLKNDFATAAAYANQLTNERVPLGFVMRAITGAKTGDREQARRAVARLFAIHPSWQSDLRGELKKYFPVPWIVDRVESDLRRAGLGMTAMAPPDRPAAATTALPTIHVEPFEVIGPAPAGTSMPDAVRVQLVRTFTRFEDVTILSEPPAARGRNGAAPAPDYRFVSTVAFDRGAMNFTFRLIDVAAGTIAWTKAYDGLRIDHELSDASLAFLGEIGAALFHQFGVVAVRERVNQPKRAGSERYSCFLESHDYLRNFVTNRHAKVRACLEDAVAADPSFGAGWTALARVYVREHQFSATARPGDKPPLERAMNAARRAIEINPQSARAHFIMSDILAAMGDPRGVRSYGEKAMALNPYDPTVAFHYGAQLIMLGDIDAGEAVIRRVAASTTMPPTRLDFVLFLASYLRGDMQAAGRSAKRITNEAFLPGYVARALAAFFTEGPEQTRHALERLAAIDPNWRIDPRLELSKYITSPAVVDRLANDLAAAGLWSPQTASQSRQDRGVVQ